MDNLIKDKKKKVNAETQPLKIEVEKTKKYVEEYKNKYL